jgi:hypothetical protein
VSNRISFAFACVIIGGVAGPSAGQPGGGLSTMTSGYGQGTAPTSETSSTAPTTYFAAFNAQNGMFQNWWYYRVQGDTRQRPFGIYTKSDGFTITGTSSYPSPVIAGTTSTYNWTENGANGPRFTANYVATLSSTGPIGGPNSATVAQSFQITNPNSAPLTIFLYDLASWNVTPTTPGAIVTGGLNAITVDGGFYRAVHSATGATAYQATEYPALQNLLTGSSVHDLNDSGVPAVYNFAVDAFEWDLTIPANSSMTVQSSLALSAAVPEPSTFALTALAGLTIAYLRRPYRRLAAARWVK